MKFGKYSTMDEEEQPSSSSAVVTEEVAGVDSTITEGTNKRKRHHHRRKSAAAAIGEAKNDGDNPSEDKPAKVMKDLDVAARAAAESVEPVESTPPTVSPSGEKSQQMKKSKGVLVRKVIKYDSDGEVNSVTEVPATKNAVVVADDDDDDDDTSIEPEKKKQRRDTAVGLVTTDEKTPTEKKKRRRRRRSRKSVGDMPDSKESSQTNVSVFMDIDHPPVCSAPCSELLNPTNTILPVVTAKKDEEEPATEKIDYSHLKTVDMDDVKEGDLIAWGDVVMDNGRPSLVWHDGILVKKTPSIVSVAKKSGDDITETTDVAVNTMFCLKCVKSGLQPVTSSTPASKQDAPKNTKEPAETNLPSPSPRRVPVRASRPHQKTAAVSGVVSFLRRMSTENGGNK